MTKYLEIPAANYDVSSIVVCWWVVYDSSSIHTCIRLTNGGGGGEPGVRFISILTDSFSISQLRLKTKPKSF